MPLVTLTHDGPVAVLTLDDGKANALRPDLVDALDAALDEAERAGAVVLAGRPGFFSGGLDLKALPTLSRADQRAFFLRFGEVLTRLALCPRPLVGAITGHAIAGGALLALATDVRFGSAEARFGLTEVPLGLPLPGFGVELVRQAVAAPWLVEVALHGRVYTHAEAAGRHLFEAALAPEAVLPAAMERARALAAIPVPSFTITRRRLREAPMTAALAALEGEIDDFLDRFAARTAGP